MTGTQLDPDELEAQLLRAIDRGLQGMSATPRQRAVSDDALINGRLGPLFKMPDAADKIRHAEFLQTLTPAAMSRLGFITQRIAERAQKQMPPTYSWPHRVGYSIPAEFRELADKGLILTRPTLAEMQSMTQSDEEQPVHRPFRIELTQLGMEVMSVMFGRYR